MQINNCAYVEVPEVTPKMHHVTTITVADNSKEQSLTNGNERIAVW